MSRVDFLNICDESLSNKPRLAAVFDSEWRVGFRAESSKQDDSAAISYPMAYWLPVMGLSNPEIFPPETQMRIERGLEVIWPQMSSSERHGLAGRLRSLDTSEACDELLAAAAFANKFGLCALRWPSERRGERRPEFFVESPELRFAVECRALHDSERVRSLNAEMLQTGRPWIDQLDPGHDPIRMQNAVVKKIKRAQGGTSAFIILTSYTPWLMRDGMQLVMRRILYDSAALGLAESELPIGIACITWTIVQGVWFSDPGCASASISVEMRDRIRSAIVEGFVCRSDGEIVTEANR